MRHHIPILIATFLITLLSMATAAPPNIIVILTDDQGYGDVSCHGNPILKTPHLDRLHAESVRFTDFHVSPTCAPTRSALLTGRHEFKNGVTHTILERERLTLTATTLAEVLHGAGYQTGIFGKWHLGDEDLYQPDRRGFDEVFIHGAGGIGQTYPGSCGDAPKNSYFGPVIKHNGRFEKTDGYCTDEFFGNAMKWIDSARQKEKPFLAWIATNAPHGPLDITPEYEALYKDKVPPNVAKFFGMIANIDDNIGKLQAFLTEKQLDDNTLVIFMNDNGGTAGVPVFNAGLRGSKVTPWEGGTRAISFWRWKNTFTPRDVSALTAHIDVFPTLAEIAATKLSDSVKQQVEGRSLLPLIRNPESAWPDRFLFTQTGRWDPKTDGRQAKRENAAVRWRTYTLVATPKETKGEWQLFDLASDPGQKTDIAKDHADIVARMSAAYDDWWDSLPPYLVNEQQPGPKWNPFHEQYWKQYRGPGPNNAPVPEGFSLP
ncbi:MAG TPA: arylsulfatase [Planctomycetaceae bacterium]|nr:arylsulfatase [Planctomycetaceae bacterium]